MKARAAAVILQDGQILLIERHKRDEHYYALPGGGIEKGETPEQAVRRELIEELGTQAFVTGSWGRVEAGRIHHLLTVELEPGQSPSWQEANKITSINHFAAVWVTLGDIASIDLRPSEVQTVILGRLEP